MLITPGSPNLYFVLLASEFVGIDPGIKINSAKALWLEL